MRPFEEKDREVVRSVCSKTGQKGNPTALFFEDEEIVPMLFVDYYMDYEAGSFLWQSLMAGLWGIWPESIGMNLSTIEDIGHTYVSVYISPHMDDVVLSCGGRIAMQRQEAETVLVVTVFGDAAGETRRPKGKSLAPIVNTGLRQKEGKRAMKELDVDYIRFDYLDAIFRYRAPRSRYRLIVPFRKNELILHKAVFSDICRICQNAGNKTLYLPLGVGQHIDHQILFNAREQLHSNANRGF